MTRLWIVLSAVLSAAGPLMATWDPARALVYLAASLVLGIGTFWFLLRQSLNTPHAPRFLLAPAGLALASDGFFLFLEYDAHRYALAALLGILWLVYAEHVRLYVFESHRYRVYTLERLTFVFSTLSAFLSAMVSLGFLVLAQFPLWILVPLFFLGETLFIFETLWASKMEEESVRRISIFGSLLLTEFFVVFSFFPLSHLVSAAALALLHYGLLGLLRAELIDRLERRVLVRYLVFVGLLLLLILSTARWS
ncbi:hypothetical protein HYW18_01525 [Candidatus Uhrbacteria bacterium]|nr:hypothetical protein [Candidatus Uhrbacteria bacterium]